MKDFPAAHSMDTMWFCTDECGHVASCWSSESGAIPVNAATDIRSDSDYDKHDWHANNRKAMHSMSPEHVELLVKQFGGRHRDLEHAIMGAFMILSDVPPEIREAIKNVKVVKDNRPELRDIRLPAKQMDLFEKKPTQKGRSLLLLFTDRNNPCMDLLYKIHHAGICECCTEYWNIDTEPIRGIPTFSYRHPTANGYPYPYLLACAPEDPKMIDDYKLSEEDKEAIKMIVVPGCFKDRLVWQPADTHECDIYDEGGEDEDGKPIKPIPVDPKNKRYQGIIVSPWGLW